MSEILGTKNGDLEETVELDIDLKSAVRREYSEFSMKSLLNYGD